MSLVDVLLVCGVFLVLGFIVLSKIGKRNPKALEWIKSFFPSNIKQKIEPTLIPKVTQKTFAEAESIM